VNPLFGVDLGGTKIEGVVLDDPATLLEAQGDPAPSVLARIRIETHAEQGYVAILERIADLVRQLEKEAGQSAKRVGIGTPGSLSPATCLLRNSNTVCLNGKPLLRDLKNKLQKEVRLANDADCFALAEAQWGAGKGYDTVFGVILGTGVGGGLVVRGEPIVGANGIAGEWGHNVLDPAGPDCYCGKKGCVETFLSGPANERFYRERTGQAKPLRQIVAEAQSGRDPAARETLDRLCLNFSRAIASVINVFDPHCVVLGGGVGQVEELYAEGRERTRDCVFSDRFETPYLKPALGDSAGVFGAALLAFCAS
jgi:fructokinase